MTHTRAELTDRLAEAADLPTGEAQVEALREVVRHAEAAGLAELEIEARLDMVDAMMLAARDLRDLSEVLTAFSRCVSLYSASPDLFDEDALDSLWRQFAAQGIVLGLRPEYPLHVVNGLFDDMAARARPDRDDLHALSSARLVLAEWSGDAELGERCLADLRKLEPAPGYVCPACLMMYQVAYLAALERDAEAIAVAQPLLTGEVPCDTGGQPAEALHVLQLCYLRTGALEEARDAHRIAYRSLTDANDADVARHLRFCVLSGNLDRGLAVLNAHLTVLEGEPTVGPELELSAAAAALCRALVEAGRGEEVLHWPANPDYADDEDEEYTYRELHKELSGEAIALAERYDRRNGHGVVGARINTILEARPIVESLALSPVAARRAQLAPVEQPDGTDAAPGEHEWYAEHAVAVEHARRGESLLEEGRADEAIAPFVEAAAKFTVLGDTRLAALARTDLATAYLTVGRLLDAAECAEEALPTMPSGAEAGHDGMQARWVLACVYPQLGQHEDGLRILAEMRAHEDSPGALAKLEAQTAEILSLMDRDAEAADGFAEAARRFGEHGDPYLQAVHLRKSGLALGWAEDLRGALERLEEARTVLSGLSADDGRHVREHALLLSDTARVLADQGQVDEAVTRALESAEEFRSIGEQVSACRSDRLAGQLLQQSGRPDEAEQAFRRALSGPADDAERPGTAALLAALLDERGRPEEATRLRADFFG
ncbi:tetratricopeptide repeat protein [Actinomadura hibisca]|uniref:tetratricopeptide repeat protein n=1 Tax=Actinomadura hibisca TaxID=68565 RepID=UPI00082FA12A|nr:tetratricopeptide repeat protein [Actinomadura hibisca]